MFEGAQEDMGRIVTAVRAFLGVLLNAAVAQRVEQALRGEAGPELRERGTPASAAPEPAPQPSGHEALLLLAALQREARLIDFLKEPIDGYSDAQIGAAAREVHRGCRDVLERMFAVRPLLEHAEGAPVTVPAGFDPYRYRLTGRVAGEPPFQGRLAHHGWRATAANLPRWSGDPDLARVLAPAEVEVR